MVVLLINKFFYEKGGTERYFFLLSEGLQRRGHDVVHFSMEHPGNLPSPYARHFVSYKDYDRPAGFAGAIVGAGSFIRSREAARKLAALIDEHKPDVAHLHNIYHQITPSIIPVLAKARVPVVMTLHDYKLLCPSYSLFAKGRYCYRCEGGRFYHAPFVRCAGGSFARSALLALEAYFQRSTGVYEKVSRFIAPSRFMREKFLAAGYAPERVHHVPPMLPHERSGSDLIERDRDVLATLPDAYVLYFGRLSAEKGLGTLLEAAGTLPEVPFVLAGAGPEEAALRNVVESRGLENVRFAGYAQKPLLERMVRNARVVVLPTVSPENAPYTVLESSAAGVPVVVSDAGGLPEMAEVLGGWVFPAGDADALAQTLEGAWNHPEETRERGAAAQRTAYEVFDPNTHLSAIEGVYEDVTASS